MKRLIAVDWGTSSLRAALLGDGGVVQEERALPRGILTVKPEEFAPLLQRTCAGWADSPGTLHLLCGMVGSRQGWREAPYLPCPAGFGAIAAALHWLDRDGSGIAIVPGLTCEHPAPEPGASLAAIPDVMRGEETQVFGALDLLGMNDGTFVLPGTHSKWVRVQDGRIVSFSTFMTGEFYALLRQHSILARTLPPDDDTLDEAAFLGGVAQARRSGSLLRSAFGVRALSLFERMPAAALPSYLSGLVIGEELRAQPPVASGVVLIGARALTQRYALALAQGGTPSRSVGSEATWRGLWAIARQLEGHCP